MIISNSIEISWIRNNIKYYTNKGYKYTGINLLFSVNIGDLPLGSGKLIHVKCDICGNEKMIEYREYLRNLSLGNEFACSTNCAKSKREKTFLKRFGVSNGFQSEVIKRKCKETCVKNCGFEYSQQSKKNRNKTHETNLKIYGFKHPAQNETIKEFSIKKQIEKYGEIWLKHIPKYNPNSIIHIDAISEKLGMFIQHALNGGEKKFIKYWVDGYIEKYNICIEWDEKHHSSKKQMVHDIIRDEFLKNECGCIIFRINEREFLGDIDNQINLIVGKINDNINERKHGK
jgi:hypothetical protein